MSRIVADTRSRLVLHGALANAGVAILAATLLLAMSFIHPIKAAKMLPASALAILAFTTAAILSAIAGHKLRSVAGSGNVRQLIEAAGSGGNKTPRPAKKTKASDAGAGSVRQPIEATGSGGNNAPGPTKNAGASDAGVGDEETPPVLWWVAPIGALVVSLAGFAALVGAGFAKEPSPSCWSAIIIVIIGHAIFLSWVFERVAMKSELASLAASWVETQSECPDSRLSPDWTRRVNELSSALGYQDAGDQAGSPQATSPCPASAPSPGTAPATPVQ